MKNEYRIWVKKQWEGQDPREWGMVYKDDEDAEYKTLTGYHVSPFGCFDDEDYIFMQWSGFYDDLGKKIYESDYLHLEIINFPGVEEWTVVKEKGCFYVLSECDTFIVPYYSVSGCPCEVRGNVLEGYK